MSDMRVVVVGLPDALQDLQFWHRGREFGWVHICKLLHMLTDRIEMATGILMTPDQTLKLVGLMLSRLRLGDHELETLLREEPPCSSLHAAPAGTAS